MSSTFFLELQVDNELSQLLWYLAFNFTFTAHEYMRGKPKDPPTCLSTSVEPFIDNNFLFDRSLFNKFLTPVCRHRYKRGRGKNLQMCGTRENGWIRRLVGIRADSSIFDITAVSEDEESTPFSGRSLDCIPLLIVSQNHMLGL
jgi:hypothetical protein